MDLHTNIRSLRTRGETTPAPEKLFSRKWAVRVRVLSSIQLFVLFLSLLETMGCASASRSTPTRHNAFGSRVFQTARAVAYTSFARDRASGIAGFRKNTLRFAGEPDAWNDLGNALAREGQTHDYLYDEALTDYERALKVDAGNAIIRYNYAVTLNAAGKTGAGKREASRAAQLAPHDFDVQYYVGHQLGDAVASGAGSGDAESAARYAARSRSQSIAHRTRSFTDRLIQRETIAFYTALHDRFPWTVDGARKAANAFAAAALADPSDTTTPYEACLLNALADNTPIDNCVAPRAKPTFPLIKPPTLSRG